MFEKIGNYISSHKASFFRGLLFGIPILAVVWLLHFVWVMGGSITTSILSLVLSPEQIAAIPWPIHIILPAITWIAILVGIVFLGIGLGNRISRRLLLLPPAIILRFPILKTIYSMVEQVLQAIAKMSSGNEKKQVVWIQFPCEGSWAPAFVTKSWEGRNALVVYMPTAPNPTNGLNFLVQATSTRPCAMSYDEAINFILSCGLVVPDDILERDPIFGELGVLPDSKAIAP